MYCFLLDLYDKSPHCDHSGRNQNMRAPLVCTVLSVKPGRQTRFRSAHSTFSFNPLPDDKILDWSKLKHIADDILKCI